MDKTRGYLAVTTVTVSVIHFLAYLPFTRLGVDPHHDGVMLHPALMVAKGFVVHRDVFSQYGPLTAVVQAAFVRVFGPTLWSIRICSCALLAATNGLLFSIARRLYGKTLAILSAFFALCLPYFFNRSTPMHPWSSDLMVLLVALAAYMYCRASDASSLRTQRASYVMCGWVVGLLPFVRQAVGLLLIITAACAVFLGDRKRLTSFCLGCTAGIGSVLVPLVRLGALGPFWQQAVIGPLHWAIDERGSSGWSSVRFNLITNGIVGVAVIYSLVRLIDYALTSPPSSQSRLIGSPELLVLLSSAFLLVQKDGVVPYLNRETFTWVVGVVGLSETLLLLKRHLFEKREKYRSNLGVLLLATSTVSIFPVTDTRHAFWAFLPLLSPAMASLARFFGSKKSLIFCASLLTALFGFQTVAAAQNTLHAERVSVKNIPVLSHMLFDADYVRFFKLRFEQISAYVREHPDASVLNICSDGLFASLGKIQKLPDPYFVSWNFGIDFFGSQSPVGQKRLEFVRRERPIVWMCPLTDDPEKLAYRYRLRLLPDDPSLPRNEEFAWWPYISRLAVPAEWPTTSVEGTRE